MDEAQLGISVIVCCYNSAQRLPETLKHLAHQDLPTALPWEIILVNNNSTDQTKQVAQKVWEGHDEPTELTIIDEPQAGLSFARAAGIKAAQYDLLLFCDDDNWLDADYLHQVANRFKEIPDLGALGGWCDPVFEGEEPDWFTTFAGNFAVGKPVEVSGFLSSANDYIYGAGMVIHKRAIQKLEEKQFKQILSDRKGKQLSSGGDIELVYALKLLRLPVYFDEKLHFKHYMPKNRVTWAYLLQIRTAMHWSNFVLGIYRDAQKNTAFHLVAVVKKYFWTLMRTRSLKNQIKNTDVIKQQFLENKLAVNKLFLSNPIFYLSTRKKLSRLQHD